MVEPGSVLREDVGNYWAGRMRGGKAGDRRAGVVWHTQGSGKSFSMLFFAPPVWCGITEGGLNWKMAMPTSRKCMRTGSIGGASDLPRRKFPDRRSNRCLSGIASSSRLGRSWGDVLHGGSRLV